MTKVLITGASGFLGRALVKELVKNGFECIGLSRSGSQGSNYKCLSADISDYDQLRRIVGEVDIVVHLAAKIYYGNEPNECEEMIRTNILGTYNLIRLVNEKKIKKFIYASSMSIYKLDGTVNEETTPFPDSLYGWTKFAPEGFLPCLHKGCQAFILRFSGLYGPGRKSGIIYKIVKSYVDRKQFDLGCDGMDRWNPLYVDDAIKAIMFFLKDTQSPGIYNVGLDSKISVQDIDTELKKMTGDEQVVFAEKESKLNFFMEGNKIKKLGFSFEPIGHSLLKFYRELGGEVK